MARGRPGVTGGHMMAAREPRRLELGMADRTEMADRNGPKVHRGICHWCGAVTYACVTDHAFLH